LAGLLNETRDLALLPDMSPEGREITGVEALGQRLAFALQTPFGFFPWWPNRGHDITQYLLGSTPLWQIADGIKGECEKDEQADEAIVSAEYRESGRLLAVKIFVISPLGLFTMTMSATEAAATLISIERAAS
jgi:hypothetical protein